MGVQTVDSVTMQTSSFVNHSVGGFLGGVSHSIRISVCVGGTFVILK